jgi:hypothetical protein
MKRMLLIVALFIPLALSAQSNGITPGGAKTGLAELLNRYSDNDQYSFFDVNEEMFKAFCELDHADSMSIALFKKIKSVKMLERIISQEEQEMIDLNESENNPVDPTFYNEIVEQLDTNGYNQLLKSRNNRTMALFLKKEFGPADNEFLLITNRLVIDIRGDIRIKTIYEMEEMMGYVQQILPN